MELQRELMIFTLFVCLGAGIFAMQGLLTILGKGRKTQLPCLITSLISIAIGGIGSFLHLEHWERIFNGFGHLSSGITQELIAMVFFVAILGICLVMTYRLNDSTLPKWCGWLAIAISIILVIVMSHSYNMAARPAWDTLLLWFFYLSNMILFGGLTVAIIAGAKKDNEASNLAVKMALLGGVLQVLSIVAYAFYFSVSSSLFTNVGNYIDPTDPTKKMIDPSAMFSSIFAGENALLFWGGSVILGAIIPVIVLLIARKKSHQQLIGFAAVGLISALTGGMCFRALLYILGFSVFLFY